MDVLTGNIGGEWQTQAKEILKMHRETVKKAEKKEKEKKGKTEEL